MRDSFIFYKSFYESIKELDPKDQVQIYNAIFEYEFYKNEPELSGVCKSIFTLIIPQLEANNKRYENGKKGGRPKTKEKPNDNQNETKLKPNVNVNDNVNENVIEKEIYKEKEKYGEFKNVLLTDEEYHKLEKSNLLPYIEKLSSYIASKNKKYKSHYATILTWSRKDNSNNKSEVTYDII